MVVLPSNQRLTYSFDAVGQRKSLIAPTGGRFTYTFDAAQRITRVQNPETDRTSFSYDAASRRTVKKLANGTRASFSYLCSCQLRATGFSGCSGKKAVVCRLAPELARSATARTCLMPASPAL